MNFKYLDSFPKFNKLYDYCTEAEEFVVTKPNISAASARKAMEFIVKFIYMAEIPYANSSLTVFEMISDPLFRDYIDNGTIMNSIHFIRKMGNVAVHDGNLNADESMMVLKELHFLVGEFCILTGLIQGYPGFVSPGAVQHTQEEEKKAEETEKEKVTPAEELIAQYAPRMRNTKFNTSFKHEETVFYFLIHHA